VSRPSLGKFQVMATTLMGPDAFKNLVFSERALRCSKSRRINPQRLGWGQGFLKAYKRAD
jgi:hypothetical protein